MKIKTADWLSSVFKIGYLPIAPGTWGSLAALILWYIIINTISTFTLITLIIAIFILGVFVSSITESHLAIKDPSIIVIDEWVGQWIALVFLPKSVVWGLSAFLLFRIFDIWKPYPINVLDRIKGGFGIMADDVLAGVYTLLIISLLRALIV